MINLHAWMDGFMPNSAALKMMYSALALKRNLVYLGFSLKEANDLAFGLPYDV